MHVLILVGNFNNALTAGSLEDADSAISCAVDEAGWPGPGT